MPDIDSAPSRGIAAALSGLAVTEATRARAAARLRYLWRWEACNAVLVPSAAVWLLRANGSAVGLPAIVGSLLCSAELLAGAAYWRIKLGQVEAGNLTARLPGLRAFRAMRKAGPAVLSLGALAWVLPLAAGTDSGIEVAMGCALWTLAVLEHVNYFHRQLMHDTGSDWRRLRRTRRLRRSFLAQDLDRPDGTS